MNAPIPQWLGFCDYAEVLEAMRDYTRHRDAQSNDYLWFLEHASVYTLGLNGDVRHLLGHSMDPVIRSDRGGQITWHGPGQLMIYTLLDLRRHNLGIKQMIQTLELMIIDLMAQFGIKATTREGAPGVYVDQKKLASVGLKVTRGCSYHGIGLNVNADLRHFDLINPCGYEGLSMTSLQHLGIHTHPEALTSCLSLLLNQRLGLPSNHHLQRG